MWVGAILYGFAVIFRAWGFNGSFGHRNTGGRCPLFTPVHGMESWTGSKTAMSKPINIPIRHHSLIPETAVSVPVKAGHIDPYWVLRDRMLARINAKAQNDEPPSADDWLYLAHVAEELGETSARDDFLNEAIKAQA